MLGESAWGRDYWQRSLIISTETIFISALRLHGMGKARVPPLVVFQRQLNDLKANKAA